MNTVETHLIQSIWRMNGRRFSARAKERLAELVLRLCASGFELHLASGFWEFKKSDLRGFLVRLNLGTRYFLELESCSAYGKDWVRATTNIPVEPLKRDIGIENLPKNGASWDKHLFHELCTLLQEEFHGELIYRISPTQVRQWNTPTKAIEPYGEPLSSTAVSAKNRVQVRSPFNFHHLIAEHLWQLDRHGVSPTVQLQLSDAISRVIDGCWEAHIASPGFIFESELRPRSIRLNCDRTKWFIDITMDYQGPTPVAVIWTNVPYGPIQHHATSERTEQFEQHQLSWGLPVWSNLLDLLSRSFSGKFHYEEIPKGWEYWETDAPAP